MSVVNMNSLVGIADYDEASNLSMFLLGHGWNADHASSAEQILADLEDGSYGLLVLDAGMLEDSEWSLDEYIQEIGPEVSVLVITEPGSEAGEDYDGNLGVLEHPFSCWELKTAIERVTRGNSWQDDDTIEFSSEGSDPTAGDEEYLFSDEMEPALY